MVRRAVADLLESDEYLVCYDMPRTSGLWGVLVAPSLSSIREAFPELAIVDSLPAWMTEAELASMRDSALHIDDDPPGGLLRALIADRGRT
jgi:hypothetical protein